MTQAVGEFKLTTAVVIAAANSRWGSNKQKWAWYVSNECYPLCCTACIQWAKADRQGVFKRLISEQHANKLNKNKHLAGKDSASVPQRKSEKKIQTHLFVLLPAFERRNNILVESCGDGLWLNDFGRRRRGFEQAIIFMGVAVLAAAR